jgi:hypothetical protein
MMKTDAGVRHRVRYVPGIVLIFAFTFACGARAQSEKVEGTCGSVFGAKVCTSYRTEAGKVTEFSMSLPIALIEQAPATVPMVWPPKSDLAVPFADTVKQQTGFTFSNIYWNPMGHLPVAYSVPHFDFHFYFVPEEEVQGFDCKDTSKPSAIPAGYILPDVDIPGIGNLIGSCIPAMGMHSTPASDLDEKTHWEGSMLVGYYSGKPIFFEPMITKELLLKKHSFSLVIPEIEPTPNVRYPKLFRAIYHANSETYDFTFLY